MCEEKLPVHFAERDHEHSQYQTDGAEGYGQLENVSNVSVPWQGAVSPRTVGPTLSARSPATGAKANSMKLEKEPIHEIWKFDLSLSKVA